MRRYSRSSASGRGFPVLSAQTSPHRKVGFRQEEGLRIIESSGLFGHRGTSRECGRSGRKAGPALGGSMRRSRVIIRAKRMRLPIMKPSIRLWRFGEEPRAPQPAAHGLRRNPGPFAPATPPAIQTLPHPGAGRGTARTGSRHRSRVQNRRDALPTGADHCRIAAGDQAGDAINPTPSGKWAVTAKIPWARPLPVRARYWPFEKPSSRPAWPMDE